MRTAMIAATLSVVLWTVGCDSEKQKPAPGVEKPAPAKPAPETKKPAEEKPAEPAKKPEPAAKKPAEKEPAPAPKKPEPAKPAAEAKKPEKPAPKEPAPAAERAASSPTCGVKACEAMGKPCGMKAKFAEEGWICLFDGKTLNGWIPRPDRKGKNCWKAEDGVLVNDLKPDEHGIDLVTKQAFKDFMLHIEFKVPKGGNSGVYLRGRLEVQVHDSFGRKPGMDTCGSIYGKKVADKVVSRKPGEWQCFNITLKGNTVTVAQNGEKIIDAHTLDGVTGGALDAKNFGKPGPLMLQGDHSAVAYRNIWIKPMK